MPRVRFLVLLLVLSALAGLLLPAAEAQTAPRSALQVSSLPSEARRVEGTSVLQRFNVTLTLRNLVCVTPANFPVTLEAAALEAGNQSYAMGFAPATLTFVVPGSEYVTHDYAAPMAGAVQVAGDNLPVGDSRVKIQITARFAGGNNGCTANPAVPAADDVKTFDLAFDAPVPPGAVPPPGPKMPGPSAALVPLVLALLGAWFRRVRGEAT